MDQPKQLVIVNPCPGGTQSPLPRHECASDARCYGCFSFRQLQARIRRHKAVRSFTVDNMIHGGLASCTHVVCTQCHLGMVSSSVDLMLGQRIIQKCLRAADMTVRMLVMV